MDDGDPWLLLEALQDGGGTGLSGQRWRAALRPCCGMIPGLSEFDRRCLAASDEYAEGQIDGERLAALGAESWARLPWPGTGRLTPELYAARAACSLLLTDEEIEENWFHWAWGVLSDCERAGVPPGELERRVRREFGRELSALGR